ncbi:MAG: hypothetical protein V4569_08465 [Pseudomonadota bacterium]
MAKAKTKATRRVVTSGLLENRIDASGRRARPLVDATRDTA